jgi:hypothetical protein
MTALELTIPINSDGWVRRQMPKSEYDAARAVCARCPGYCCYMFFMQMPLKGNGQLDHDRTGLARDRAGVA